MMYRKHLFIVLFLLSNLISGQTIRNLSEQEKNQLARLKEMAEVYSRDGDAVQAGQSYSQMAKIYWGAGLPREAVDYYLLASENYLQKEKFIEVRNIYTNIGVIYTDIEELEFAKVFFEKSLTIRKKIGNKTEIAAGLFDIAYINQLLGFYDDAIKGLEESLALATAEKNSQLILDCYQLLSFNYEQIGNLKKSKEFAGKWEQYQAFLQEENLKKDFTTEVMETKKEVVKKEEEKKLAEEVFRLRQALYQQTEDSLGLAIKAKQDSLFLQEGLAKAAKLEIETLNQQRELDQLRQSELETKQKAQRMIILMIAGGFALMVVLAIVMLRANRARKRANNKLEKQNREIAEKSEQLGIALKKIAHQNQNITQSINYAKGIQQALLPKADQLTDYVKDSFILFKPRDIVSGDFYYFREVDSKSDIFKIFGMHRREQDANGRDKTPKKIVVSAVDCTGHGVPGAFMSMIGYNLLDEITNKGITRPDLILEELHRGVRFTLKQKETNNQDGMDISICVIDPQEKMVEFAGAKNPLIYIQNGNVEQIKGDKNGIGGKSDDHNYTLHKVVINGPTWFYIFSDGFIDQFGGDSGRKFMIKTFRELIFEIHQKPMQEQKEILAAALKEWIGTKFSQIDDVLVIGFKLDISDN
jgi:serine phosphatase RsbU (regulator of sigma subunit)